MTNLNSFDLSYCLNNYLISININRININSINAFESILWKWCLILIKIQEFSQLKTEYKVTDVIDHFC
jgi:hypothetical protein